MKKARKVVNLNTGEVFDTYVDAMKAYALTRTNILQALSSSVYACKAGGCRWKYLDKITEVDKNKYRLELGNEQ